VAALQRRQACRLLDAASRTRVKSATSLRLNASTTRQDALPNWSRFPHLRGLSIFDNAQERTNWRDCFDLTRLPQSDQQQARASLANITDLELRNVNHLPALLTTMLQHMPNVTRLALTCNAKPSSRLAALCVAAAPSSSKLEKLTLSWPIDEEQAAYLTERLPNLKTLTCEGTVADLEDSDWEDSEDADEQREEARAQVWAALPCARLTALRGSMRGRRMPLPVDHSSLGLPWLQMRELHDVHLPFHLVEQLAAGLPNLVVVVAQPTGVWGPTPAVFERVERVILGPCLEGLEGAGFAKLFPVAQRLVLDAHGAADDISYYNVAGMTALTHLWLWHELDAEIVDYRPDMFTVIATLPRLQCLVIDVPYHNLQQLSVLSRLSTLQALAVHMGSFADRADVAVVLSAFSSLTTLHTLCIQAGSPSVDHTTLGPAVRKLPRSLRNLKLVSYWDFSAVALITTHPGLRNLIVRWPRDEGEDDESARETVRAELDKLVSDCKQRGVRICSAYDEYAPLVMAPLLTNPLDF